MMTWEVLTGLFLGAAVSGVIPIVNAELLVVAAGFVGRAIRFGGLAWAGSRIVGGALCAVLLAGSSGALDAQLSAVRMLPVEATEPGAEARPAWASAGVPHSVWVLAEAASEAEDREVAKALLVEAEVEARVASEGNPESVELRFSLAVVLGLRAEYEGGRTKIRAAAGLYEELTAVLEREPEHARAQHLLGRLHAGVRRMNRITRFIATRLFGGSVLAGASWEDAERYLAFAEREVPDVSDHHMQLAALYRDTSRPGLARLEIRHVLAIEATSPMERAVRDQAIRLRGELPET